jgi:hypothetical protein
LAIDASGVLYGIGNPQTRALGIAYSLTPPTSPGGAWIEAKTSKLCSTLYVQAPPA